MGVDDSDAGFLGSADEDRYLRLYSSAVTRTRVIHDISEPLALMVGPATTTVDGPDDAAARGLDADEAHAKVHFGAIAALNDAPNRPPTLRTGRGDQQSETKLRGPVEFVTRERGGGGQIFQ